MALYLESLQNVKFVFQQIKIAYALPQVCDFNSQKDFFSYKGLFLCLLQSTGKACRADVLTNSLHGPHVTRHILERWTKYPSEHVNSIVGFPSLSSSSDFIR